MMCDVIVGDNSLVPFSFSRLNDAADFAISANAEKTAVSPSHVK